MKDLMNYEVGRNQHQFIKVRETRFLQHFLGPKKISDDGNDVDVERVKAFPSVNFSIVVTAVVVDVEVDDVDDDVSADIGLGINFNAYFSHV